MRIRRITIPALTDEAQARIADALADAAFDQLTHRTRGLTPPAGAPGDQYAPMGQFLERPDGFSLYWLYVQALTGEMRRRAERAAALTHRPLVYVCWWCRIEIYRVRFALAGLSRSRVRVIQARLAAESLMAEFAAATR